MPIYGFACSRCGHRFDRLQRMSESDPTSCPGCNHETLSREVSAPRFRLAGGGWYETDFKSDPGSRRNLVGETPPSEPAIRRPRP